MDEHPKYDGSSIEVLDGLQAIRLRPHVYVRDPSAPGTPANLLRQAFCHAVDCAIEDACSRVQVRIEGRTASVSYDAGLPLKPLRRSGDQLVAVLFLTLHAGCKNLKKHIKVGDELCDLGLAVLNGFCESMVVETNHEKQTATFEFAKGIETRRSEIQDTKRPDGTTMTFRLDPEMLGDNVIFEEELVRAAVDHVVTLIPSLNVTVEFIGGDNATA